MNVRPPLTRAKWLVGCAVASIAIGAHAQSSGESADALLRDSDAVFKQLDAGQYVAV
ncbi:membrane protein [Burkholderia lata]|nr:membrane protein [Burkholderia lata]